MMKRMICILLLSVMTLLLASCHGHAERKAFTMPETFDESRDIEITFWAKNDTNKAQTEIYQSAIDGFEALYPNVHVTMRLYTDYGKIFNDVITNIATETTPNVCITYPDHIATYMSGENVVVPLDDVMTDEKYGLGGTALHFDAPKKEEIVPQFLSECHVYGQCMALPFMRSTEACYVNKDFVEALGYTLPETLTWDFIFEVSEAAMAKNDDGTYRLNGQKTLIPFIYKSTDNMMIQMLWQRGKPYSDAFGSVDLFNDEADDILLMLADHAKSGSFSTFKRSGYPANFLNAGQCIFAVDSTAGATWMGSDAPLIDIAKEKIVPFETAVMTVPQYDVANPLMISQGPSVCVFNKADENEVLASWLFAAYLLTDDVQLAYAETEGYVPVTLKAQQSDAYLDYLSRMGEDAAHYDVKIKASGLLIDNTSHTFVTPVFNGSMSLRDASGQLIEDTVKASVRGTKIDEEYFDKLHSDVTSLYRLDQQGGRGERVTLGALPEESVTLLVTLVCVWLLLLAYYVYRAVKQRKNAKNSKK